MDILTDERIFAMENEKRCQSCGMSDRDIVYGKNANGTTNTDYCSYCYNHGKFTSDMTMDQMIEHCAPHLASQEGMTRDEARHLMRAFFPTLKRWNDHH